MGLKPIPTPSDFGIQARIAALDFPHRVVMTALTLLLCFQSPLPALMQDHNPDCKVRIGYSPLVVITSGQRPSVHITPHFRTPVTERIYANAHAKIARY